jgi:5'-3' exonuclease
MIPGWHFNWNNMTMYQTTPEQGLFNFWCQTLAGDATDNIPGLPRVGKKTAEKILKDVKPSEFKTEVLNHYSEHGWGEEELHRNAQLLWILRKPLFETYGKHYEDFFK